LWLPGFKRSIVPESAADSSGFSIWRTAAQQLDGIAGQAISVCLLPWSERGPFVLIIGSTSCANFKALQLFSGDDV
jgi:hypothetical protein